MIYKLLIISSLLISNTYNIKVYNGDGKESKMVLPPGVRGQTHKQINPPIRLYNGEEDQEKILEAIHNRQLDQKSVESVNPQFILDQAKRLKEFQQKNQQESDDERFARKLQENELAPPHHRETYSSTGAYHDQSAYQPQYPNQSRQHSVPQYSVPQYSHHSAPQYSHHSAPQYFVPQHLVSQNYAPQHRVPQQLPQIHQGSPLNGNYPVQQPATVVNTFENRVNLGVHKSRFLPSTNKYLK